MSSQSRSTLKRPPVGLILFVLGAGALLAVLYLSRPWWHGVVMLAYQYPLVTWVPVMLGLAVAGVLYGLLAATGNLRHEPRGGFYGFRGGPVVRAWPGWLAAAVAGLQLIVCAIFLPAWQGRALYQATEYAPVSELPYTTQPRILPKDAAQKYGDREDLRHAHLVVNPTTHELTWSAEDAPSGIFNRGASKQIAIQPLDRLNGDMRRVDTGFRTAVSHTGPGSLPWKAYKKHYFTRVQERVVVPLADGRALAVAPYIAYKGFLVKRPYWKGVYVLHQDGKLEDLTPEQAMARPELRASGRLFPEKLARAQAEAYGYKHGIGNAISAHREQIQVHDPSGNPQPYLTNLSDRQVTWVTVGSDFKDAGKIRTVFLTDSATGRTQVWTAPKDRNLLSNAGAVRLAESIREQDGKPVKWTQTECCDQNGYDYEVTIRWATEPRPVFKDGRFYYLVSIMTDKDYVKTREPVERTVLVDATERTVVKVYNHNDSSEADDELRTFFGAELTDLGPDRSVGRRP